MTNPVSIPNSRKKGLKPGRNTNQPNQHIEAITHQITVQRILVWAKVQRFRLKAQMHVLGSSGYRKIKFMLFTYKNRETVTGGG
jgi:hypothetical protein